MQPLGEASVEEKLFEKLLEPFEELGEIAEKYLNMPLHDRDTTYGIRDKESLYYIGNKQVTITDNNITSKDEKFKGTPDLWDLIMSKEQKKLYYYPKNDRDNYERLMVKTSNLHRDFDPSNPHPRSADSDKWNGLLSSIWFKSKKYEGEGVVIIPSDPNALVKRLDILLSSEKAGHTGVRNELVSICDELKRQGVLDSRSYKNLISNIKK